MKNKIVIIGLLLFSVVSLFGQQQDIDIITERLVSKHLKENYEPELVAGYMAAMNSDGSWHDIDYDKVIREFPAGVHLTRLIKMTLAYRQEGSSFTGSEELLKKILSGLDFYYKKQPKSTNWWYNDIGSPQNYMIVLILLKGHISKEKLHYYSSYIQDKTDNQAHKGKNRTWVSAITMYKGCIEDNYGLISIGFNSIASTIMIADKKMVEGIKTDNSIHQHRPQLYSGGYGMSFMSDLAQYIYLSRETSFRELFTPEKIKLFSDTMLEGQRLFGYRQTFDFGTEGRNISRYNHVNNASPELLELMKIVDPENAKAYDEWMRHLDGGPFSKAGNKFFWNSAIVTHHGSNYYLSAKVISTRTNGTEMLNGENLRGYYLPLGATNILVTGKEYKNIFPVWDWTHIPGTTAAENQSTALLEGYHFGTNKYAGGVTNGKSGCIAFEHDYKGIKAKKSYFFIGDAMLCLGTGISVNTDDNIMTTLNQCYADGEVHLSENDRVQKLDIPVRSFDNLDWVHHGKVGYIFPDRLKSVVQRKNLTGSWRLVRDTGDEKEISADIFSLWVDHGVNPRSDTYCYIVVPDISLNDFKKTSKDHGFKVIKNTEDIQAVSNKNTGIYAVVFYNPGILTLDDKLEISVDKEAIVLIEKIKNGYQFSVSDPLYEAQEINIKINKKLQGDNAAISGTSSTLCFELPQDEYAGQPIIKSYETIK